MFFCGRQGLGRKKKTDVSVYARRVAGLLAATRDAKRVAAICRDEYGVDGAELERLLDLARSELALAADVDLRFEFGTRRAQLEDVRERAKTCADLRAELDAIKELNKLCGLYDQASRNDDALAAESTALELVREHLEGLELAPRGLPIEELARRVVAYCLKNGLTKDAIDGARRV